MKKRNIFRRIFGSPIVRGTIKTLPFGNLLYELAENIKLAKEGQDKIHHPQSLIIQFLWLCLIVYVLYGVASGKITFEQLANFLKVSGFESLPGSVDLTDSVQ